MGYPMGERAKSAYREQLRQVTPVVNSGGGGGVGRPSWAQESDGGWMPLFDVLNGEKPYKETREQELKRLREGAYRDGYEEGLRRSKETVESIVNRYHAAIADLETVRDQVLIETEEDLVQLAIMIAQQVLMVETDMARDFTMRMAEHVLSELRDADQITLRVGSTDMVAVQERHPELVSDKTVVRVIEDPSIEVGGVVAECALGRVDATVERRLVDIAHQLLGIEPAQGGM